jgi:hypothetical protein
MPLPVSLKLIVPVMLLPFWVTVQLIFPGPLVSADVPVQVPLMLPGVVTEPGGEGEVGDDELPPHAETTRPASRTKLRYIILIFSLIFRCRRYWDVHLRDSGNRPLVTG